MKMFNKIRPWGQVIYYLISLVKHQVRWKKMLLEWNNMLGTQKVFSKCLMLQECSTGLKDVADKSVNLFEIKPMAYNQMASREMLNVSWTIAPQNKPLHNHLTLQY
jgi:hypothetical protein